MRKNIDFSRDGNFFKHRNENRRASEVVISAKRKEVFLLKKMGDFEKNRNLCSKN